MALSADLSTRLDANELVSGFIAQLTGSAGALTAIAPPASGSDLELASSGGGSFLPATILDAVQRFATTAFPSTDLPATVQLIEGALTSIEQLTTRDIGADLSALVAQLGATLEARNDDGWPGTLLELTRQLESSPLWSALRPLLASFASGPSGLSAPEALGDYLPALASTIHVVAGLMTYQTVLSEGERSSAIVASLFSAGRARQAAQNLEAAFRVGDQGLAAALAAAEPSDGARIDALSSALENAAARLEVFDDLVSRGMGFGEATLVHFDVSGAQQQMDAAGALLRSKNPSALRRVVDALARTLRPIADALDPGAAAARGAEAVLELAESSVAQAATAITSLDASPLVVPLRDGLASLTSPLRDFGALVERLVTEVRAALEQVRAGVASLPIDDLAVAIRSALEPVTRALEFIEGLVDDIREALELAAGEAVEALGVVEGQLDAFQQQIRDLFEQARTFVDGLHLEQVVSTINDAVGDFVGLLQQAQLSPYFDTASSAIGSAADVIAKVPLDLLPDSMKADLDRALAPVREVDPEAVEAKIESLLQIGPDGSFQLRGELEAGIEELQAKFEELLRTLDEHHPRRYVEELDRKLAEVASQIQAISPQLTLEPVQQAIAQVKSALGSFDLELELAPVQSVFDTAIETVDRYSPSQLIAPLAERVSAAREQVKGTLRLADWRPALDDLGARLTRLLDVLDPSALQAALEMLLERLRLELDALPELGVSRWLGLLVAGAMQGSSLRLEPASLGAVARWVEGAASAPAELSQRSARIAESLATARREVEGFDPASFASLGSASDAIRSAALALAAELGSGERSIRLRAAASRLDVGLVLGRLAANRSRYLELLGAASALGDALGRTGLSETGVAVQQLREPFEPLEPVLDEVRRLASYLGIGGDERGLGAILRVIFGVATPARIAALVIPLVGALRDRFSTLIDELFTPVRTAIDDLERLIDQFELAPIIESIQAIFGEVRGQLLAYSPSVLLREQLDAFAALKQTLLDFDPLAALLQALDALRDTAARVVGKLSAERLLESPLAIYDSVLDAIRPLEIDTLLAPVIDAIDAIALQVDQGLDETVDAFKRLQEALPAPGGGSQLSGSISVT